jgi:class 3 adenylate cyclase/tetratricopeptide (TPR) repeat protein
MRVCVRCAQENPDVAKFCLACGTPLAARAPTAEERKLITVLFTDIVGSTAKAEQMDPEDVRARLAPYYIRLRRELERFGGTVEKFIGDAVVALFGAPVTHEDDPERAVRAALAIREAIHELNVEDEWLDLSVRIGVNTGEALVVLGAKASEGEGMAAGDVMNTAARLQSAAPVNGVLVGELTYRATRDAIEYAGADPIAAKGKTEPVAVWEALNARDTATRPATTTALVGRERELEALVTLWETVLRDRLPGLATVVGLPGIGKSRLLAELTERTAATGSVHWGRCLPYGEGITYWPISEIVKSAAGILQSDARETVAAKLDRFLEGLGARDLDELRTIAAALSNVLGIPTTPRGTYSAAQIGQGELHWGIRRTLQLLALRRPALFVFEDLHWAEPTLLELITYVAAAETEAPLLVVGSGRPELEESFALPVSANGRSRSVRLDTLSEDEGVALLADLVGDRAIAESPVAAALIRNAGGNPLFLGETVRMLRDEGLVGAEAWATATIEDLPIPTSVQGLISSRLDRLEPRDKHLAHNAAVIGSVFWAGAVEHLAAPDTNGNGPVQADDGLASLAARDFVRRNATSSVAGEDEYAFTHILIRDVAYGQIPKGRRMQLHVRFSDWVTILPGSADEFVEIVAWHLEQACRLSREVARAPIDPPTVAAAGALANAARRAELREGLREAERYYARAIDVLSPEEEERRLELRVRHADIALMLGHLKEASHELLDVSERAGGIGRPDVECEALVLLSDIDHRQGRASDARTRLKAAEALADEIGDGRLQIKIGFISAYLKHDFEGDFEGALEELRRAASIAEDLADEPLRLEGHLRIAVSLMNVGRFVDAEGELLHSLGIARAMGSRKVEAEATAWLGGVKYYLGHREEGKRLGLQAREWLERTGDSYFIAQNLVWLAAYALLEDDPPQAEAYLREALPVALEFGGWLVLQTYRYLSDALVQQGKLGDARDLVSFAARSVPEEDPYPRAELLRAEATVAAASREWVAASTAFAEALRLLESVHLPVELAETRIAFARALRAAGEDTAARTTFELARSACSRMRLRTLTEQIDRELAQMEEGADPTGPLVPT